MIYKPKLKFYRDGVDEIKNVFAKDSFIIIDKDVTKQTPLWIYIVSSIGGLLVLILLTYILFKLGFFQRKVKKELIKLKRESQISPNYNAGISMDPSDE